MRVKVLGGIDDEIRSILGVRLSESKDIKELSVKAREEAAHLRDTEVEYVKYSSVLGRLFGGLCEVFLKRPKVKHSISASVGKGKNLLKYSGVCNDLFYKAVGYNRLSIESNLSYIKGKVHLYAINPRIPHRKAEGANRVLEILKGVNRSIYASVLANYLNIEGEIEKDRKYIGIEHIINAISKIKIYTEKDKECITAGGEVSFNPVDHKYAKIIASTGMYRKRDSTVYPWCIEGSFYLKFVYPILDIRSIYEKNLLDITKSSLSVVEYVKSMFIQRKCTEKSKTDSIMCYLLRSSLQLHGEVDSTYRYNTRQKTSEHKGSIIGLVRYTIGRYGIVGGLCGHTTELSQDRSISPVLGASYALNSSIIDTVNIIWPWDKMQHKKGLFSKLHAFEINITKEY